MMITKLCPCGSTLAYDACCGSIIEGRKEALTCEALMRSRYVAFTMANIEYLIESHHTSTRQIKEIRAIKKWTKSIEWMGLIIVKCEAGDLNDEMGYVEFRAFYREAGQMEQIHERSLFNRENNKWVYLSGEHFDRD